MNSFRTGTSSANWWTERQRVTISSGFGRFLVPTVFIVVLFLSRLAILLAIGYLAGGVEFTDDVRSHVNYAAHPLAFIQEPPLQGAQHPPLLPLLEGIFYFPFKFILPDFYSMRLVYIIYELLAGLFFYMIATHDLRGDWRYLILYTINPTGWMTSTVMAHNETIASFWLLFSLWLVFSGRNRAALLVAGLGVVAAKVLIGIGLTALVMKLQRPNFWRRLLLAIAPIAILYSVCPANLKGLTSFAPYVPFGTSIWTIIESFHDLNPKLERLMSGILTAGVILGVFLQAGQILERRMLIRLVAVGYLLFLMLFYHVNPKYYALVAPLLILEVSDAWSFFLVSMSLTVPWMVNLAYGVSHAMAFGSTTPGKAQFVNLYLALIPLDPGATWHVIIAVNIVFTALLAVHLCRKMWNPNLCGRPCAG